MWHIWQNHQCAEKIVCRNVLKMILSFEFTLFSDINECALATHNCHADAYCTNSIGSFTCTCKEGYVGNGVSCVMLDYSSSSLIPSSSVGRSDSSGVESSLSSASDGNSGSSASGDSSSDSIISSNGDDSTGNDYISSSVAGGNDGSSYDNGGSSSDSGNSNNDGYSSYSYS